MAVSFNSNQRQVYNDAFKLAKKFYAEYNDKLMDLLEKYGYLISEKEDASRMKF